MTSAQCGDGPSRRRRRIVGWWGLAAAAAIVAGTGMTAAAFVQTIEVSGTLSGGIDIAQGPAAADQHASPGDRKILARATDTTGTPAATLHEEPTGAPDQSTAEVPIVVQAIGTTPESTLTVHISNQGTPQETWNELRFGLYEGQDALTPSGIPVAAEEIADVTGIRIPAASTGTPVELTLKIWMEPDAPLSAYNQPVSMTIDLVGQTVGGDHIATEVTFP